MNPLVSIIIPTYNGAAYIAGAIESVLSQEYLNWELLIISDGSTDDTKTIVEKYSTHDTRIVFSENENNSGIQKTLNRGIALAKGKYIARLDDDDRWIDPTKLAAQVDFLEANEAYVLLGTDARVVDEKGSMLSVNVMPKHDREIRSKILSQNCFLHATVVMRKTALDTVGGYSETSATRHAEDYDLWLRLGTVGKMANLPLQSTALTARDASLTNRHRVVQARHVLGVVWMHRKNYPHFISGYSRGIVRLVFFSLLTVIPIPSSIWYRIQRTYRAV